MCRNSSRGGRRCPSHSDPVLIAVRNARRRAKYAAHKSHAAAGNAEGTLVDSAVPVAGVGDARLSRLAHITENVGALVNEGESEALQRLRVNQERWTDSELAGSYFDEYQVSGVIDHSQLDDDSYKAFGFKDMSETRAFGNADDDGVRERLWEDFLKMSEREVSVITPEERAALFVFTGDGYNWINDALYVNDYPVPDTTPEEERVPLFSKENLEKGLPRRVDDTDTNLKEITRYLDSAMAKAPRMQRTVYRGVSGRNSAISTGVSDYIDENLSLGQEIMFDGYQSSTASPDTVRKFASDGIILEIKTSSGVNVSGVSRWGKEREVLLPRNARYMVVGVHKDTPMYALEDLGSGVNASHDVSVVQLVEINDSGEACNAEHTPSTPPELTDGQLGRG